MNIVIVDSHPVTHYGIKSMVEEDSGEFVISKSYFTANGFFKGDSNINTQLIIVGSHIVDIDAYNLITYIHNRMPKAKAVLYSCHFTKEVILKAIQSGANGVLSKNLNRYNFIKGLLKVFSSDIFVSIGNETMYSGKSKSNSEMLNTDTIQLTYRENEILNLIVQGVKNKEIASILKIALSTVEFHRKNIYSKLEVRNVAELISKVHEVSAV